MNDGFADGTRVATHWLADKRMMDVVGGDLFHVGYRHCYCDRELTFRAQRANRYVWAKDAKIEHDHPPKEKKLTEDYKYQYSDENTIHDRNLFWTR